VKERFMKRLLILTAAACVLTAGSASAQSPAERAGVNSALGVSPSTPDFVKEVAISDMFEIESSKLAQQKGDSPTKSFADHMIMDHTKTSMELKSLVQGGKVRADLPNAMDSSHQTKLDKLKSLNGDDFSKNYDQMQRDAHKDAVDLFGRYAKGGDNAELKQWASTTLPALQTHLKMAEDLPK
jgi:putative membrane protein